MLVLEFLTQLSLLVGIIVGIYGIDSWRREHLGRRRLELAEETLALFFEAEDAIHHIRHPISNNFEREEVERGERESDEQYEARKSASVVFFRYNQYQELFAKIRASRYRFMAQIGKVEAEPFDELHTIVNQIMGSARALSRLWPRSRFRTTDQQDKHWENIDKYEAIFWEGSAEEDPINPRLEALVAKMERSCREILEAKGTLQGILDRKVT